MGAPGFFQEMEGEAAVVVMGGVYRQVPLYRRGGHLFAAVAGGFVRLMADGSTSKAKMRLETLSCEEALHRDALGRLCTAKQPGAIPLEDARAKQLLIGADP